MAQVRVHELAKGYGMSSGEVLDKLRAAGMTVKAPASAVDADVAIAALEDRTLPMPLDGVRRDTADRRRMPETPASALGANTLPTAGDVHVTPGERTPRHDRHEGHRTPTSPEAQALIRRVRMAQVRVHELAKVYGMSSGEVLNKLRAAGMSVKAPASAVDADVAIASLEDRTLPMPPDGLAQKTAAQALLASGHWRPALIAAVAELEAALKARDATSTERPRGDEANLLELINSPSLAIDPQLRNRLHRWRAMRNAALHEGKDVSLEFARQALADVATALAVLASW